MNKQRKRKSKTVVIGTFSLALFGLQATAWAQQGPNDGRAVQLDEIQVQGNLTTPLGPDSGYVARRTLTGAKTDTPLIEIPQTINVITADQIRNQGAQTLGEALRYSAGVAPETYGASSQFDSYVQLRGFKADMFLDGLRLPDGSASTDWATAVVEPYGLERVEILRGPSGALYGQSGPGGIVNMVSKRPTATPLREVQIQTGSFSRLQGTFDFGGPVDPGGQVLYRFTGLVRQSQTQVDFMHDDRLFLAPALTFRPSDATSLTVMGQYLRDRNGRTSFNYLPTSGTLRLNPVNGRLPFDRYAGEPGFDRFDRDQAMIGYVLDHRFNETVSFSQSLRFTETDVYLRALNRNGELLPDNRTLNRAAFHIDATARTLTVDNRLVARFNTGALSHTALIGLDYRNEQTTYNVGRGAAPPIDIFNPTYGAAVADPGINFQTKTASLRQLGLYAQDQIKLGGWVATLSGRYDWASVAARTTMVATQARTTVHNDNGAFTGRAGLSYVFDNGLAPYVSYSTSFQPTAETNFFGQVFRPLTSRQYEAGIKYQPAGINASFNAAIFDIRQQNTLTTDTDPSHPFARVQLGEVSVRGFDAEARMSLGQGWGLIASYAYLDHKVTRSSVAAEIGRRLPATPVHQASLWADYTVQSGGLAGLTVGAGLRYVGNTTDPGNTVAIPPHLLVDASLQYDLGNASPRLAGARLSVTAKNLFDTYYISQCGNVPGCTLGSRRTVLATLTYRW